MRDEHRIRRAVEPGENVGTEVLFSLLARLILLARLEEEMRSLHLLGK